MTFHPGIYECTDNGNYYKLVLNEDSTYQLIRQGPSSNFNIYIKSKKNKHSRKNKNISNFYPKPECGIWKYRNDTLILMDSLYQVYDKSGVVGEYINGQNYVSVTVKDEKNNPFSDILVSLNYSKHWEKTNSAGLAKFEYKEIKKIIPEWIDTIPGWHTDTLSILSLETDNNTGRPKIEINNVKKTKSEEDIPILDIQIKKGEKPEEGGWLNTFENKKAHVNHFTIIQDFHPINKREIRIRKLPVVDNVIIFTNPSYKRDGHTIRLVIKK